MIVLTKLITNHNNTKSPSFGHNPQIFRYFLSDLKKKRLTYLSGITLPARVQCLLRGKLSTISY